MEQGNFFYFLYKLFFNLLIFSISYTKMGWAGNPEPTYDIPTVIADTVNKVITNL